VPPALSITVKMRPYRLPSCDTI